MQLSLLLISILLFQIAYGQQRSGVEEFFYVTQESPSTVVPRVWWENNRGWYAELRYNYEAEKTCSLYGGKTFSGGHGLSWSLTPVAGLLGGAMHGESLGINLELEFRKWIYSSASQYSFAGPGQTRDFYFSWNELGIQLNEHIYTGMALQQTIDRCKNIQWDPGLEIGVQIQKWVFPLYFFTPLKGGHRLVLGVTREWAAQKRKRPF